LDSGVLAGIIALVVFLLFVGVYIVRKMKERGSAKFSDDSTATESYVAMSNNPLR